METEEVVISVRPDRREGALVGYGLRATSEVLGIVSRGTSSERRGGSLPGNRVSTLNAARAIVQLRRDQESSADGIRGLRGEGA